MARAQASVDPAAVITAYEMARNRRDVDTALSYFADDAVINQRSTSFNGKDEIRKFLDGVAARARFIVVSDRRISGNRVSWTERLRLPLLRRLQVPERAVQQHVVGDLHGCAREQRYRHRHALHEQPGKRRRHRP